MIRHRRSAYVVSAGAKKIRRRKTPDFRVEPSNRASRAWLAQNYLA
jgi:hypothetical protein